MVLKINLFSCIFLILSAFIDNPYIPFHLITLILNIQMSRWQHKNKDYIYVLLIWVYKLILLFFIKKAALLWVFYDLFCIFLGIYFLMRALRFFFCK